MSKHLLVAITPHGFGHAAQVAPVINALRERCEGLRVTVQSLLPEAFLRERISGDFRYRSHATDFGVLMASSLDMCLEETAQRYARLHGQWDAIVKHEMACLAEIAPDLLLANVPYVPLAAARQLSIPAVGLCSLHWADIYRHYFGDRPEAGQVLAQMESGYRSAEVFLQPQPSMPMATLDNTRAIAPIASRGRNVRTALNAELGLPPGERLVLLAPGGVPTDFPLDGWPKQTGVKWVLAYRPAQSHDDVVALADLPYRFVDVLGSVDAVVGKCGYGTVAECACNGTPLLYMPRPEWPEERYLLEWLTRYGRCAPVAREQVAGGNVSEVLEACLARQAPQAPVPSGAVQAADILLPLL